MLKSSVMSKSKLRRIIYNNVRILSDARTYVGLRHRQKLPVHGQRTRTNANTRRRLRKFAKTIT